MRKDRALLSFFITILTLVSLSAFTKPAPVLADGGCGGPFPPKPGKVWARSGSEAGTVKLFWSDVPYANRYAVAYGTKTGKYVYGADNIGGSGAVSYTVKGLTPGVRYHFVLAGANGCASSPFSAEVTATATGGEVAVAQVAVGAPVQASQPSMPVVTKVSGEAHHLWTKSGPNVGEVTLYWNHAEDVDNYHLVYGTSTGVNQYGALNIGKVTSYTVKRLTPGMRYYFSIVPVKNNQAGKTTPPIAGMAMMAVVEVVMTSPEALIQPPTVPPVTEQPPSTPPADTLIPTVPPTTEVLPTTAAVQGEQTVQPPTDGTGVTDPTVPTVEPTAAVVY